MERSKSFSPFVGCACQGWSLLTKRINEAAMWIGFIYVALGGAIGASLRHGTNLLSADLSSKTGWPWGTFSVNILGSLLMGLLMGWLLNQAAKPDNENLRLFLATGVLGGFTTFSAFSLEIVTLFREGAAMKAALYAGSSVLIGVVAIAFGLWIAHKVTS